MSRIGKLPIGIPKGVTVSVEDHTVRVKGPKGELTRIVAQDIGVAVENDTIKVTRPSDEPSHKALHGLTRTLIANMVEGVTKGYQKQLEISGVGYKAEIRPYGLQLALGFSHPVQYKAPAGIKLTAPQPTQIFIDGADIEGKKTEKSTEVGKRIAARAKEAGITKVVFDRAGYRYHGRVKALADGAREGGLEF